MVEFQPSSLDAAYAALSHPARRAIIARLRTGDARVTELAAPFDMSLNAVSKHIRLLEASGLVRRRVSGRDHWLSLEPQPLGEAAGWLEAYRTFWEGRLDALDGYLRENVDG